VPLPCPCPLHARFSQSDTYEKVGSTGSDASRNRTEDADRIRRCLQSDPPILIARHPARCASVEVDGWRAGPVIQ
jgi:hypothetical protein